jgi:hypothetical protein
VSGGSFNYLYTQDPYREEDLEAMANELWQRGMYVNFPDLLGLLAARDARDSFERATGWAVLCAHDESPEMRTLYGPFAEPAAALIALTEWETSLEVRPVAATRKRSSAGLLFGPNAYTANDHLPSGSSGPGCPRLETSAMLAGC